MSLFMLLLCPRFVIVIAMQAHGKVTPHLSRRQLIVGAAGVTVAAVVWEPFAEGAEAAPVPWAATSLNRQQIEFYSGDFSLKTVWQLASTVALSGAATRAKSIQAEFVADARVLAQRNYLTIERGDRLETVSADTHRLDGSATTTVFTLTSDVLRGGVARLALPMIGRLQYPEDGLDGVIRPTIKLTMRDAGDAVISTTERALALESTTAVAPWGVLPSAGWISLQTSDHGVHYRVPAAITLRSVGPHPTPAGVQIALSVDAAQAGTPVVTSVSSGAASLDPAAVGVTVTDADRIRTLTLTINEPPAPGQMQTIALAWPAAVPHFSEPAPSRAAVTILTAGTAGAPRRKVAAAECLIDDPNRPDRDNAVAKEAK